MHVNRWFSIGLGLALLTTSVLGQDSPQPMLVTPPLAFIDEIGRLAVAQNGGAFIVDEPSGFSQARAMTWSADGRFLAFLRSVESAEGSLTELRIAPADGSAAPVTLRQSDIAIAALSWTIDGRILYTETDPSDDFNEDGGLINFYSADPQNRDLPRLLGSARYQVGCGGGGPGNPHFTQRENELNRLSLISLNDGRIAYSADCGGRNLNVFDPASGTTVRLADSLYHASLSPSGALLAGISEVNGLNTLRLIDVATGQARDVATRRTPDQIGWGADDSTLFYSNRQETGDLITADQQRQINIALGFSDPTPSSILQNSAVFVQRLNLVSGEEIEVYNAAASSIQRLQVRGDQLFFSQVPTPIAWAEAILSGAFDPLGLDANDLAYVPVAAIAQDINTAQVALIGLNISRLTVGY